MRLDAATLQCASKNQKTLVGRLFSLPIILIFLNKPRINLNTDFRTNL